MSESGHEELREALASRRLWLLGGDVGASPSPAMHNAALAALGLPAVYEARSLPSAALDAVLDEAEASCAGINVTAPFKTRVAERYASALDDVARECGAVNAVCFRDGRASLATNTDVHGLMEAWRRAAVSVLGRTVAIVGAGGAARASVIAAKSAGAERVLVHARNETAASALVNLARTLGLRAALGGEPAKAHLAVFAVPALDDEAAWLERVLGGPGVVHDLRYGGRGRALRNAALAGGHLYLDGATMLLAQGRAALAAFLGLRELPPQAQKAMEAALARALR